MNDIISNQEYREILRRSIKKGYMIVLYIMIAVAVFFGILAIVLSSVLQENEPFNGVWFLIPIAIVLVIGYVFYVLAKKIDEKESPHFSYDQFVDYQAKGTKIPMYRMVNYGNNNQLFYVLLDLDRDQIEMYDHKKKGLKPFKSAMRDSVKFTFFYKTKDGYDIVKKKVDVYINGRKERLYGYPEIIENMIDIVKVEGYEVNIR